MGLDFAYKRIEIPHESPHWSYSGFDRFRKRLAAEIGIDLDKMEGFDRSDIDGISWDTVDDAIAPLLNHSDCEGELPPEVCDGIYPRLIELVQKWPDDDYDKINALRLAAMMKECGDNDGDLLFT